MKNKLCIILGAGASASINLTKPEARDDPHFKPVTTPKLFQNTFAFREILNHYALAKRLEADIYIGISRGESLESILKIFLDQLFSQKDTPRIRQFLQIPLYLNELFYKISRFTHQPREYNYLINRLIETDLEVLFLTLNYDSLLELSLQEQFSIDFNKSDHYINNNLNWKLVKLHGSINWYYRFHKPINKADSNYFNYINTIPIEDFLDKSRDFIYQKIDHERNLIIDEFPLYPVIAIPVEGKYEYYCPEEHYLYAKQFLQQCMDYLIIGTKGLDQDLVGLLKENANSRSLMIVGHDDMKKSQTQREIEKDEIVSRFRGSFKTIIGPMMQPFFSEYGFSDFVSDPKGLDKYLKIITES